MSKETWDEIQQTILLILIVGLWIIFEYWCYQKPEYAAGPQTNGIRLVITGFVTGLMSSIYTKSGLKKGGDNGGD